MAPVRIEDVFKVTGVPTYTFVRPSEYNRLQVALRTPGRGVVVEGPSGIGKSTAVTKALEELGLDPDVTKLSARIPSDVEYLDICLLYTSDAADEEDSVDLGGRRII